ncbi:MAG: LLM class flavin-dependent oxidoreductase [Anaerolineales bacterium]|nr:LLM class flavin-dependent oxidoreductase [Anaerolineales bacterium]
MHDLLISPHALPERRLRFGVWVPPFPGWPTIQKRVRMIEELGFDSIWIADHFANPFNTRTAWMEAWSLLAGIAACTNRIRVGTLVSTLIYRNPALLAKQAMTIDNISRGRLTLGLGAGVRADPAHRMTGVPAWENRERVARFEEGVQIICQMLREEETTFDGEYYQVAGAVMLPRCVQRPRPPLLIGADGRRMLSIAGRFADAWNMLGKLSYSHTEFVQKAAEAMHVLTYSAKVAGRDPQKVRRSLCLGWTREDIYAGLAAFRDYLSPFIELGFTEFMLGYWHESDIDQQAPIKHLPDEERLIWMAKVAIPSLRSIAQTM